MIDWDRELPECDCLTNPRLRNSLHLHFFDCPRLIALLEKYRGSGRLQTPAEAERSHESAQDRAPRG